jgi:hypothetical protein
MKGSISRRDWITGSVSSGLAAASAQRHARSAETSEITYHTFWGDLHNHNNIGYAQGSLRRTFEIARNHLDFFAFTPHAHWHDMGHYVNNIENKWINGFAVTSVRWPEVLQMAQEFDAPGKFVPIAGYEWHSASLGDYHILFPDLKAELKLPDDLRELQKFARTRGCIMIPHHPANRLGHRGANFGCRDPEVSPLLEMYSEWGNAEHDRAPFPYIRHTEGGRWTKNTLQYLLAQGHRVGVIASTDDHLGYPGAYREGLAAVKATSLTRDAIFDALWNRRTYGVTGDRIALDFTLNGHLMGQEMAHANERELRISVSGWDQIDRVEVLKNNRVIHRDFPVDRVTSARSWERPVLVRFEFGWGPWPVLGIGGVCDWNFEMRVESGSLDDVQPCFQSGPLEEDRRDVILEKTDRGVRIQSFTALRQQFEDISTKAIVLKARGGPNTRLTIALERPVRKSLTLPFAQLAESGEALFTGPFPKESALVHRLVFAEHYETSFPVRDRDAGAEVNWYYVRVAQANGQLAWSSPIWVEKAST